MSEVERFESEKEELLKQKKQVKNKITVNEDEEATKNGKLAKINE